MNQKVMKHRQTVFLSDEIVEFISGYNVLTTGTKNKNGEFIGRVYTIDSVFRATEDPNIFDIATKESLLADYCRKNEIRDKSKDE